MRCRYGFLLYFIASLSMPLAAEVLFMPSITSPMTKETVTAGATLYCGNMSDPYPSENGIACGMSLSFSLDCVTLLYSSAFAFTDRTFDITQCAVYWPLIGTHWNIGAGGVVHFKADEDIFNETDILLGGWTRWRGMYFEVNADVDYMLKSSRIHAIDGYVPRLINHSMALSIKGMWHIPPARLSLYASIASWDESSFMLFFAPRFTAGMEWTVKEEGKRRLLLGLEATAVYIDMATLSSYCEGTQVKAFIKWIGREGLGG